MDLGMWSLTWKIPSVTSRQTKLFIVGKSPSKNGCKHLCKQKQGAMRVCWGITINIKGYEGDSRAKKTAHKISFSVDFKSYWPHQGINSFLSDNLCSTLNLELDMKEEWHCKILVGHNSGSNIQVYKTRAKIQFYYAEREKLSFMLLQFSIHWHFIVRTIIGLLPTADIMVIYRSCSNG